MIRVALALAVSVSLGVAHAQLPPSISVPLPPLADAPLELSQAINLAWHNSLALQVQNAALQEARASQDGAEALRGPSLNLSGTLSQTSSTPMGGRANSAGLQANWTVWDGGQGQHHVQAAQLRASASVMELSDIYRTVALDVVKLYLEQMAANMALDAEFATVRAAQASVDVALARERAGVGAALDVAKARSNLAQAQLDSQRARAAQLQASARLANATGNPTMPANKLADWAARMEPVKNAAYDQLLAQAQDQRPSVRSAALYAQAAQEDTRSAQAAGTPQITWTTALLRTAGDTGAASQTANELQMNVTLTHSLWDGGSRAADIRAAQARQTKAELQSQSTLRDVALEVRLAFIQVVSQQEAVAQAATGLQEAIEVERTSLGRYRAGAGTLMDVLDAQARLATARRSSLQAQADLLKAHAEMQSAIGVQQPLATILSSERST